MTAPKADTPYKIWILFLEELCISKRAELSLSSLPLLEYDANIHEFVLKSH